MLLASLTSTLMRHKSVSGTPQNMPLCRKHITLAKYIVTLLDLTSFVGAQGQEVEISRSAFAFIRDTIPVHVHLREEDDSAGEFPKPCSASRAVS